MKQVDEKSEKKAKRPISNRKKFVKTDDDNVMETSSSSSQQNVAGMSKVYILDKYFHELQKFWETEKRLQGKYLSLGLQSIVRRRITSQNAGTKDTALI